MDCFKKRGNTAHNAYPQGNYNEIDKENHACIKCKRVQLKHVNRYLYYVDMCTSNANGMME